MKLEKLQFNAVIPTQQYGNIQPGIEMSDVSIEEGTKIGVDFISDLFSKYSEKGGLVPREILVASGTERSFNEGIDVLVEPIAHTYHHGTVKLQGVTDYVKKLYKPFDSETMSTVLEPKWKVDKKIIKEIWDSNGELASEFGTIVHKALELYHRFKEAGEVISYAKGEISNYVIPKHPILRSIVKGFIEIDQRKGKILSEKLLTNVSLGICGRTDAIEVLDEKKNICRVGDYKINIDSEEIDSKLKPASPFEKLPANKLSKYQIQLSIYANMLQKSGWVVEGLDVWVYEDTWKHYPLEVLQVI